MAQHTLKKYILIFLFFFPLVIRAQPVVKFTSPLYGKAFAFGAAVQGVVAVTTTGDSVSRVELIMNHGTPDTLSGPPFSFSCTGLVPGVYLLQATAFTPDTSITQEHVIVVKHAPYTTLPAAPAPNGKVKIFILAGQSNMVGTGELHAPVGVRGTMDYYLETQPEDYGHLVNDQGVPVVRNDVWVVNLSYADKKGWLTVGFGSDDLRIGPEYAFGQVMGDYFQDPVLLIKTAWGGKSLAVDFLSPASGPYSAPAAEGDTGYYYQQMVAITGNIVKNLAAHFPSYTGNGYEIAGIGWHQGWNDRINGAAVAAYEENLTHLINDVRNDLGSANLPFVVANTGISGWDLYGLNTDQKNRVNKLVESQLAVADYQKYPAFKNNVGAVETRGYWRHRTISPSAQDYHWYRNFESYYLIGESMAHAMIHLLLSSHATSVAVPPRGYDTDPIFAVSAFSNDAVSFVLPEDGAFALSIIDLQGRVVKNIQGTGLSGHNRVCVNLQHCARGVFNFRLSAGKNVTTRKIFLVN